MQSREKEVKDQVAQTEQKNTRPKFTPEKFKRCNKVYRRINFITTLYIVKVFMKPRGKSEK